MKKIYDLGAGLIFLALIVAMMTMISVQSPIVTPAVQGFYNAEVCTSYRRAGESDWVSLGCSPNNLTTNGKNAIEAYLGTGGAAAFNWIALANNSAEGGHDPSDTDLDDRTSCCGLEIADGQGAYGNIGDGNWSISAVFTCDTEAVSEVNATGLFNASDPGTYFAWNTFTPVDLQVNDQINVTWTIWVTG